MNSMPHQQKNELRANLLALSEACPSDDANPEDCPLFLLRKMKPRNRLQWLNALTDNDLVYLATYHRVCFTTKVDAAVAQATAKP
ncbi:MAG: hypothetical protein NT167_18365 [Verrucomicrobia bacterium]|nr:hypothetical protein [Verrucomicrobiota bacterium]